MNRSRYVPFERNRYFYGKLLTVRDFMTEQTYNADKRRLVNRLLYGSGVVSGLQVIAVDDKSISIETGVALDALGREIVVPSPVTLKLSNVDGFTNNDYAKNIYLCLAYDEKAKEPVHAVGGVGNNEEVNEHNRIQESYRIYVTEKRPKFSSLTFDHLLYDQWTWYEDGLISIYQQTPRYMDKRNEMEITLVFEKTLQAPPISFEFQPVFEGMQIVEGDVDGKIVFHEPIDSGETRFVKKIVVKLDEAAEDEEVLSANILKLSAQSGSAKLTVGDRIVYDLSYLKQKVELCEEDIASRVLQAYYNRPLDTALEASSEPSIYIAQINLLQLGASYVIDKVIQQPFGDYIINPTLLYRLIQGNLSTQGNHAQAAMSPSAADEAFANVKPFPPIEEEFARILPAEEPVVEEPVVLTGVTEISIVPEKKKKWYHSKQKVFYSEEIKHGLANQTPSITIAISDEEMQTDVIVPEMWQKSNSLIIGDPSLFKNSPYELNYPKVSWSIIHFPDKGSFIIALKVHKKTERLRLKLRWWAAKAADVSQEELRKEQLLYELEAAAAKSDR